MPLDLNVIRARFPALSRRLDGRPVAYLDGPGGTQVPAQVIAAMSSFMEWGGSNLGGPFATSRETDDVLLETRAAVADLFKADPGEIVFGQNMSSLTFPMSRALADSWSEGDNVVLTRLDHDANISPWLLAAAGRGVEVRWADFNPADGRLDAERVAAVADGSTRLVAVTGASNALGTIVDLGRMAEAAHSVGALVYVDGVHRTPHGLVDVASWDVDFYAASAYKFFGPHTGMLYGKQEHLERLDAYKVRAAPDSPPDKWETGTQSFESLAGVTAAVDYLASLGEGSDRRARVEAAMAEVVAHGESMGERFLAGAAELPQVTVYGITDDVSARTPTFAISVRGRNPVEVATRLGDQGIFVWAGHYYAVEVMRHLGVLDDGGLVRIGFVHYNTPEEVDRVLDALQAL